MERISMHFHPQDWSRLTKKLVIYGFDASLILISTSLFLLEDITLLSWLAMNALAIGIYIIFSFVSRSHQTMIHTSNLYIIPRLAFNTVGTFLGLEIYLNARGIPIPFLLVATTTLIFSHLIFGSRIIARYLLNRWFGISNHNGPSNKSKVIVYGAGYAGKQVVQALAHSSHRKVVGFIDDNKELDSQIIGSVRVYRKAHLPNLLARYDVKEIILCMPSAGSQEKKRLMHWLQKYPVKLSVVPDIENIVNGEIKVNDIKEVSIEDLLSRKAIQPDPQLIAKCTANKNVLISGAGGSIGSEICRQVLLQEPKVLVLFELSEYNLYKIEKDLLAIKQQKSLKTALIAVLGDVKNEQLVEKWLNNKAINTVYHAAAYKHVPLVEANPAAAFHNNVDGTRVMARKSGEAGVKHFVLISSDKAVRPTNVMGATKRLAEHCVQAMQDLYPSTIYSMVRFGNVLGSSGSVIPLFKQQIAQGGPVTVTDERMIRYFMTIPEAASLVIQAGAMAKGGDVFLLDMGEPVKIMTLAKRMIHLSGLRVDELTKPGDISIQITGLRPGEKLYEELLIDGEAQKCDHPRIFKTTENYPEVESLLFRLQNIKLCLDSGNTTQFKELLVEYVEGYVPDQSLNAILQRQDSPTMISKPFTKRKNVIEQV